MSERITAPRSGGRTTEQVGKGRRKPTATTTGRTTGGGARGARHYPADDNAGRDITVSDATQGTAALKLSADRQREPIEAPRLRVAPPAPINAPRAPFIALVVAVVVAGVIGILLINTKTAENAFTIDSLQDRQRALDSTQQGLENQIAANNSPGSLDAAARRLGLVKADNPAYIRLPDGKVFGVPKPGSGEVAVTAQDPATAATGR